jgi:hypothetical protein
LVWHLWHWITPSVAIEDKYEVVVPVDAMVSIDAFVHLGAAALKFMENLAAPQGEFEALRRSHQKVILKHRPGALQRAANRRLAQQQPRCGRGDAFSSAIGQM